MLIDSTTGSLAISAAATGNVRKYQSIVGGILLLSLPLTYIAFRLGGNPEWAFIVNIFVSVLAYIARLIIIKQLVRLNIRRYIVDVFAKSLKVTFYALILPCILYYLCDKSCICSIVIIIISIISSCISVFFVGLDMSEQKYLFSKIKSHIKQ